MTRRLERDVDFVRGSDLVATSIVHHSTASNDPRLGASATTRLFRESSRTSPPRGCARKPEFARVFSWDRIGRKNPTGTGGPHPPRERLGPPFRDPSATTRAMLVIRTARRISRPPLTFLPSRASLPARRSSSRVPPPSSIVRFVVSTRVKKSTLALYSPT